MAKVVWQWRVRLRLQYPSFPKTRDDLFSIARKAFRFGFARWSKEGPKAGEKCFGRRSPDSKMPLITRDLSPVHLMSTWSTGDRQLVRRDSS